MKKKILAHVAAMLAVLGLNAAPVFASAVPNFTQQINAGTLSTDILDATRTTVASPTVALTAKTFSFNCYYTGGPSGGPSTGALGSGSERVYVMNPDNADNGWVLSIAATGGIASVWTDGGSNTFDFNDPTTSGCTDGGDADSRPGQMTIDPNAGTLTADCLSCVTTNVTKGSVTSYSSGVTDSITVLTAAAGSDDVWRGYLTGATVSQTIPAEEPAASYSLSMTLSVVAS